MSHEQLPEELFALPVNTGSVLYCGPFSVDVRELLYAEVELVKFGTRGGSEQARLNVYSRSDMAVLLYSSSWRSLSDLTGIDDASSWIGRVRFDFNRQNLNPLNTLHVGLELDNYTRNGNVFFVAARMDYPDKVAASYASGTTESVRTWFYGEDTI